MTAAYALGESGLTFSVASLWWGGQGARKYFNFKSHETAHHFEAGLAYTLPVEKFPLSVYGVPNSGFAVTNVALKGITEIKITDSFSIPVFAQAIWNPRMEDAHLVFGFTLRP